MLLDDVCGRLLQAARIRGWAANENRSLTAQSFRGSRDLAGTPLPEASRGIILGRYAVLVCELDLTSPDGLDATLRAAHNQMLIARTYLTHLELIDAHIVFAAQKPSSGADWKQQIDLIERNEKVCRKLVWMLIADDIEASFDEFASRSFLAQPWKDLEQLNDAPLDQNENVVEEVLRTIGLTSKSATAWVGIARNSQGDPDDVVDRIVAAMEFTS